MLLDSEKNTVLFSELFALDYPKIYEVISRFLKSRHIRCLTIPLTKDYWCRDYMPIQVNKKKFVQFIYKPDYLKNLKEYETDVDTVMDKLRKNELFNDIEIIHCPIIIDGGNVTICKGEDSEGQYTKLIMTDKVMVENPSLSQKEIETIIKESIGERIEFVWLPWEGKNIDKMGHTDAMIKPYGIGMDNRPILLANLRPYGKHGIILKRTLEEHCNIIELDFSKDSDINWALSNYLQTNNAIVVPSIEEPQDDEMISQMKYLFDKDSMQAYKNGITGVPMRSFIKKWGGAINCITWQIKI